MPLNWFSRKEGKSNVHALRLAADACLPLINAVLNELKTKTYPEGSFLNIIVPTDVANHRVIFESLTVLEHNIISTYVIGSFVFPYLFTISHI